MDAMSEQATAHGGKCGNITGHGIQNRSVNKIEVQRKRKVGRKISKQTRESRILVYGTQQLKSLN